MSNGIIYNPYLPLYEYIPDGEPHIFPDENWRDRVYVYGSHDRFGGEKFCMNHYVSYSAPTDDLTDWRYEGVIYRNDEDPRMRDGGHELWAPDVTRGADGRYYLYYCPDDRIKSIGVAVCDTPAGKYEFYGLVCDKSGAVIGEREGDTYMFDPSVFIDDDGRIYLYSGNGPQLKFQIGREPKGSVVMELESDMLTAKTEPKKMLPTLGESYGTPYEGHAFFEASSIRKIGGRYYLVYSSSNLHELCYAVSDNPDGPYEYGGVIISNAEKYVGDESQQLYLNAYGNNHGGIEKIGGDYYIFYHRQTNRSHFSRQGCAEKIEIRPDGAIPQVHITSQGLYGKPLPGHGTYPAPCAAVIHGKRQQAISHILAMGGRHPYITQDAPDADAGDVLDGKIPAPTSYIANVKKGFLAAYRYFDLTDTKNIGISYRGRANGKINILAAPKAADATFGKLSVSEGDCVKKLGEIPIASADGWRMETISHPAFDAISLEGLSEAELILTYEGRGRLDIKTIILE